MNYLAEIESTDFLRHFSVHFLDCESLGVKDLVDSLECCLEKRVLDLGQLLLDGELLEVVDLLVQLTKG
jgi:hypothetical protein